MPDNSRFQVAHDLIIRGVSDSPAWLRRHPDAILIIDRWTYDDIKSDDGVATTALVFNPDPTIFGFRFDVRETMTVPHLEILKSSPAPDRKPREIKVSVPNLTDTITVSIPEMKPGPVTINIIVEP